MLKPLFLVVIFITINPSTQFTDNDSDVLEKFPASISYMKPSNNKNHVQGVQDSCKTMLKYQKKHRNDNETHCGLRPTIVPIDPTTTSILKPSMELVNKCVGSCSKKYKCVATNTTNKIVYVEEISNGKKKCSKRTVVEDVECKCSCPEKATDCKGFSKYYDKVSCKCRCTNHIKNCDADKKWNESRCLCECKQKKHCTSNSFWDEETCRCWTK